ncbi:hypothetical protein HanIR_Chr11g0528311 [Helianthus annuus]|nr:hypothetical protein HanIR_Chr11g0528311 [Helianthus annuus]
MQTKNKQQVTQVLIFFFFLFVNKIQIAYAFCSLNKQTLSICFVPPDSNLSVLVRYKVQQLPDLKQNSLYQTTSLRTKFDY